jgi:hypothetical protein
LAASLAESVTESLAESGRQVGFRFFRLAAGVEAARQ